MVTPAEKREAVTHLRGAHEMSERRACKVISCDRMTVRYRCGGPTILACANGFWRLPRNAGDSATGACSYSCAGRALS